MSKSMSKRSRIAYGDRYGGVAVYEEWTIVPGPGYKLTHVHLKIFQDAREHYRLRRMEIDPAVGESASRRLAID